MLIPMTNWMIVIGSSGWATMDAVDCFATMCSGSGRHRSERAHAANLVDVGIVAAAAVAVPMLRFAAIAEYLMPIQLNRCHFHASHCH